MSILANALARVIDSSLISSEFRVELKEVLYKEAERLAGRPVEVEQTEDGQHIVLWMSFVANPPPKSTSEAKALAVFIDMMLQRKGSDDNLPEVDTKENTDGTDTRSPTVDN